jgi:hypothetical protein
MMTITRVVIRVACSPGAALSCKDAILQAHLLLTVVQAIAIEIPDLYEYLGTVVDGPHPHLPLELLLMCGIYADANSLVSAAPFKLVCHSRRF